ncbi:unnamed protein product [Lactuca saligna]|uniref:Uncharacterized protein n=1 Tax=Lactuca saligna TaxID=75948 RepID=A0AA36E0V7_LACSI|nr:unnamed protein product [Lactuca saligna]
MVEKTQKARVLSVKLQYNHKRVDDLESEKTVVKSCDSEINQYLQRLFETHDSIFIISVRQHLSDKLQPVFSMLNEIECVSGSGALTKQGGKGKGETQAKQTAGEQEQEQKPKANDQNGNEASASNKGKEKLVDKEEEEFSETENLIRKKRDKELNNLLKICKELEAQEAEAKIAKVMLENLKSLFPSWSIKRIQKEAINNPSVYWLLTISFELNNEVDSQFDFPITPRAFRFWCFEKIEKALIPNNEVSLKLFNFYLKYAKPQYQSWSLKRIMGLKVYSAMPIKDFMNIRLKGFVGVDRVLDEFTLADLPFMNPYHWISFFNIVVKDEKKYEPIIAHLRRMLICYILVIAKMDTKIALVLQKIPTMKPEEEPRNF